MHFTNVCVHKRTNTHIHTQHDADDGNNDAGEHVGVYARRINRRVVVVNKTFHVSEGIIIILTCSRALARTQTTVYLYI